jgi:sarcosine oxidase
MAERAYDLAVIGVGGMGAAVMFHAARRGMRVLGIERFDVGHDRGSSHGVTRILRLGVHEGADYVSWAQRARDLWLALGDEAGEVLFHPCGSVDLGPPESEIVRGSRATCEARGVPHEVLDAAALRERIPVLNPDDDMIGVLQPGSGMVACEASLLAHVAGARVAGAEVRCGEAVVGWEADGDGHRIVTGAGEHRAAAVVVTAGAWAGELVPELAGLIRAERQVVGWFHPDDPAAFAPERMPCWILDGPLGHFYGLPVHGIPGFKLARMAHEEEIDDLGAPVRPPQDADVEDLRAVLRRWFPRADGPVASLATCIFETTPDRDFIIDRVPGRRAAWVAAGFSGHGYKYCGAVGEAMAALVAGEAPALDTSAFALGRFAALGAGA